MLKNHKCSYAYQGVFLKDPTKGYTIVNIKWVTKLENVQISLKATSKLNFPGTTPTWNASTWRSRWGELILTTYLDCCRHLWPGTTRLPLQKILLCTPPGQAKRDWAGCILIFWLVQIDVHILGPENATFWGNYCYYSLTQL